MELFDVIDSKGNPAGQIVSREKAHAEGIPHRTAHIWIIRKKEGRVQILLQKRSQNKDSFPGCYDISSAGHLERGEDFEHAALREPLEELGLHLKKENLRFLSFEERYTEGTFAQKTFRDLEYTALYLYDGQALCPTDFALQKEEVEEVVWMDADLVTERLDSPDYSINREEWQKILAELPF